MPTALYVAFAILTVLSMLAAQRLAKHQGRKALPWMLAAAVLGPFPLIPLALHA